MRRLLPVLLLLAGCGGADVPDGEGRLAGVVSGRPDAAGERVELRFDGPADRVLAVRTGEQFEVSLRPGTYRVSVGEGAGGAVDPAPSRWSRASGDGST